MQTFAGSETKFSPQSHRTSKKTPTLLSSCTHVCIFDVRASGIQDQDQFLREKKSRKTSQGEVILNLKCGEDSDLRSPQTDLRTGYLAFHLVCTSLHLSVSGNC